MGEDFYKDKAWELLLNELGELKKGQAALAADVSSIKEQMRWVFGLAAGVTLAINIGWAFLKDRWQKIL